METPQPDKTGMHILLKLASLRSDPRGHSRSGRYHCAAVTGAVFAIVLNPLVPGLFVGEYNAPLPLRL